MSTMEFFNQFWGTVQSSQNWKTMENTVENSPWHREANVAVHTAMTIEAYGEMFYSHRTERQRTLTLMALLFHDFGKPEAEETLEKKEEPGVFYRRYAGHEPISGNEFLSFMIDNHELRRMFFDQGFGWKEIRMIKVMIEHHLPYGLKNVQKRQNLKHMIENTLGEDEVCFYDMLRSDCHGRISDDHDTKKANVEEWISEFETVTYPARKVPVNCPELVMMVGVSGAGKSTMIKRMLEEDDYVVFGEDELRLQYAAENMSAPEFMAWTALNVKARYEAAWQFCHLNKESKFDQFSRSKFHEALETGKSVIVDRMNQGRKARGTYIQAAKQKGYKVISIELFMSESMAKARQKTRPDKALADYRVHQIVMQLETPWYGPEVDEFKIVAPS